MDNKKSAGLILILIAIFQLSVWFIYLVVSNPYNVTWQDNLNSLLAPDNELMPWFYASIASILLSFICAITYFSKLSNSKPILLVLMIMCMLQAVPAIWFLGWILKGLYTLPVISAYLAYKNPNKRVKCDAQKDARALP